MTLIGNVFSKLQTAKILVTYMSKEFCLRTFFGSHLVKESETLLKISPPPVHHIVLYLWQKLSWKMSQLVISDILGLSVNTLTADDKCFLRNRKNLPQPIQMQLSKKQKCFLNFFVACLRSTSNLEHIETKDGSHCCCIRNGQTH